MRKRMILITLAVCLGLSLSGYSFFSVGAAIDTDTYRVDQRVSSDGSSTEEYYLPDGTGIDRSSMSHRYLNKGKVSFLIPDEWKAIEHNIADEDLGTIEGYQYVLNRVAGESDAVAESFFVCYFDKNRLVDPTQMEMTGEVEGLIIKNISGKDIGILDHLKKAKKTYYGAEYHYFLVNYKDALGTGYRAEYVFQPVGSEGLVMYLYVYQEPKHISDIMFVTRFLEIK